MVAEVRILPADPFVSVQEQGVSTISLIFDRLPLSWPLLNDANT